MIDLWLSILLLRKRPSRAYPVEFYYSKVNKVLQATQKYLQMTPQHLSVL